MKLNLVVRGQSNAILLMTAAGGAGAAALQQEVQRLLGFDGVQDTIRLVFSVSQTDGTAWGGTSLTRDWYAPVDGDWTRGWAPQGQAQALLAKLEGLPDAVRARPTAVLWLHNEYDGMRADLSAAEWASAVRADAALVRAALGQGAATVPYLFVDPIPFDAALPATTQQIRAAMQALAADPGFHARIAARAPDLDMDRDDRDGTAATRDFGGGHMSDADALLLALRAARGVAQEWADFARPGSPVAQAGGAFADAGPKVVAAWRVEASAIELDVRHDGGRSLAPLDADAARGLGWSLRAPDGGVLHATSAIVQDGGTLRIGFAAPLPAGGVLDYAWGYGRLAGMDGSGHGNAVADLAGLPAWTPAAGVTVAEDPGGSLRGVLRLGAAGVALEVDGLDRHVDARSLGLAEAGWIDIDARARGAVGVTQAAGGAVARVALADPDGGTWWLGGFAETDATLGGGFDGRVAVRRTAGGDIRTGSGDDSILVAAGGPGGAGPWDPASLVAVASGAGEDSVTVTGWRGVTSASVRLGPGDDHVTLEGCVAARIAPGPGADRVTLGDRHGPTLLVLRAGEADGDRIEGFAGAGVRGGDVLRLIGYGPEATVTALGEGRFRIDGAVEETVLLPGVAALGAGDVVFIG